MRRVLELRLLILLLWPTTVVLAAGGAHIVDDSEVETPGHCHLEYWVTRFLPGDGYANASPACTPAQIPFLETGVAFQHYWTSDLNAPLLGPTVKVNVRQQETGLGLGIDGMSGVNVQTGDLNFATIIGLASIPFDKADPDKARINLNLGWSYLTGNNPNAVFYGAQIEAKIGWDLMLMIEGFGRAPGVGGVQMGLRYTPLEWLDFDLLAASFLDSTQPRFFTFGVTIRY